QDENREQHAAPGDVRRHGTLPGGCLRLGPGYGVGGGSVLGFGAALRRTTRASASRPTTRRASGARLSTRRAARGSRSTRRWVRAPWAVTRTRPEARPARSRARRGRRWRPSAWTIARTAMQERDGSWF